MSLCRRRTDVHGPSTGSRWNDVTRSPFERNTRLARAWARLRRAGRLGHRAPPSGGRDTVGGRVIEPGLSPSLSMMAAETEAAEHCTLNAIAEL